MFGWTSWLSNKLIVLCWLDSFAWGQAKIQVWGIWLHHICYYFSLLFRYHFRIIKSYFVRFYFVFRILFIGWKGEENEMIWSKIGQRSEELGHSKKRRRIELKFWRRWSCILKMEDWSNDWRLKFSSIGVRRRKRI
jgi:hypothetical protein